MVELPEELRDRPVRPANQEPTATLTLDAYLRIKAELDELTTTGREQITEKIKVAREHGDLKENAEYHAAKDEQGLMESKIRKMQQMLRDPEIVEAPAGRRRGRPRHARHDPAARRGRPRRRDLPARRAHRGEGSRRPDRDHESPLGTALMGATEGQEVAYQAPGGTFRYSVVSFEPHTG